MSSKREAELKSAFTEEMERSLPGFLMLRFITAGAPDRSITGHGRTTHWEFKHAAPNFESQGLQELMCLRLAAAGHCRYVIWRETAEGTGQRTLIVHPRAVHNRRSAVIIPEAFCLGFDQQWLVDYVRREHRI